MVTRACPLVLLLLASIAGAADFPKPLGRVNDFAGILSEASRHRLQALVEEVERETTAELFVVTVPTLEGLTVEAYANKLFNAWGIGKKGKDNGLLVLVCPSERRMRIEVGYGLEATVPDGLAGQVIRDDFTPHFKAGDYPGGMEAGAWSLARIVLGREPSASPAPPSPRDGAPPDGVFFPIAAAFLGLLVYWPARGLGYAWRERQGPLLVFMGILTSSMTLPMLGADAPWAWKGTAFAALLAWIVRAVRRGRRPGKASPEASGAPTLASGPGKKKWVWLSPGGGRGGRGGGSSSGGGGGRSGGGGASGGW
jgi:uncharacterized protein